MDPVSLAPPPSYIRAQTMRTVASPIKRNLIPLYVGSAFVIVLILSLLATMALTHTNHKQESDDEIVISNPGIPHHSVV